MVNGGSVNCWEFRKCGKEKKGKRGAAEVCPAGDEVYGRVCYAVTGTLCNGTIEGNFPDKYKDCKECDYFKRHAIKDKFSKKLMCWEVKKCGREVEGSMAERHGVCPAASPLEGRACWVVAGTFCGGKAQGTFAQKIEDCRMCDFFIMVKNEHLADLQAVHGAGG